MAGLGGDAKANNHTLSDPANLFSNGCSQFILLAKKKTPFFRTG
jgi:hypothetical protein